LKIDDEKLTEIIQEFKNKSKVENNIYLYYNDLFTHKNQEKPVETIIKEPVKIPVKIKPEVKKEVNYSIINPTVLLFIKIIMSVIGALTLFIEVYFNNIYLSDQYDLKIIALILSIIFVSSVVISFEVFFLFSKQKDNKKIKNKGLMTLFLLLWIICAFLTIKTTLAGQYNKMMDKMAIDNKSNTTDKNQTLLFNDYTDSIKDKQIDLESKRKERDKMQEILSNITDQNKDYNNITWRITVKDKEILSLTTDIDKLKDKKNKLLDNNIISTESQKKDFNVWLASIFHIDIYIMQFI
jgi:hypothetical protein